MTTSKIQFTVNTVVIQNLHYLRTWNTKEQSNIQQIHQLRVNT